MIRQRAVAGPWLNGGVRKTAPDGPDVGGERVAERVVADLSDECDLRAERGGSGDGVGPSAAGDLHARTDGYVQCIGPLGVDQRHAALGKSVAEDHLVGGVGDHVDDRVADPEDVQFAVASAIVSAHPGPI
jgi:hypothetical protein